MWWTINDALWCLYDKCERYIKFSLVGVTGVAIHFGLLYVLTEWVGWWYLASAVVAVTVANLNNYLWNHLWTFRTKRQYNRNLFKGWLKYMLAVGVTELIYLGLMYFFTSVMGFYYLLSAFLSLMATTGIRYATAEKWIWAERNAKKTLG